MKIKFLLIYLCLVAVPEQVPAQWVALPQFTNQVLDKAHFPDAQTGFVLGSITTVYDLSTIFRTVDGGQNWEQLNDPVADDSRSYLDIFFLDEDNGYIMLRVNNGGLESRIYKTENAGLVWSDITPVNMTVGNGYGQLYFTSVLKGFAGIGEEVYKTQDGGENWTLFTFDNPGFNDFYFPRSMDFLDEQHGVIGGWDGTFGYRGGLFTTANAGEDWQIVDLPQFYSQVISVSYPAPGFIYALGGFEFNESARFFKSGNSGQSWDTIFIALGFPEHQDMVFLNADRGFIVTRGGSIYETIDQGETWLEIHDFEVTFRDMEVAGGTVYATTENGLVYKLDATNPATEVNAPDFRLPVNLVTDILWMEIPASRGEQNVLRIFNMTGQLLYCKKSLQTGPLEIPVDHWTSGKYIVEYQTGNRQLLTGFIKR